MNLVAECAQSAIKSIIVSLLSVFCGYVSYGLLFSYRKKYKIIIWSLVLIPYLTPALLMAYAYSNFSLS
ncbi:MAG: hypothetical protein ABIH42_10895, partial [Planctomycetota bacterium]